MRKRKIVVTGGAGYIGSVLSKQLLMKDYDVSVIDSCLFGDEHLFTEKIGVELHKIDLRDIEKHPELFEGVDCVMHLGGFSNDPQAEFDPELNDEVNHIATEKLAKVARDANIKVFTFGSSASLYDNSRKARDFGICWEETELNIPEGYHYSIAKKKAEDSLQKIASEDFKVFSLRQGTVYGWSPRMRYDLVVNAMVKSAIQEGIIYVHGNGEMYRPLIDVNDCARAHIHCFESRSMVPEKQFCVYNLVYKNYNILSLAHLIKNTLSKIGVKCEVNIQFNDIIQRDYRMSGQKIATDLGFVPEISAQESVSFLQKIISQQKNDDFHNPIYYNIQWVKHLSKVKQILKFNKVR